jgi:hypothetical protein
MGKALSASLVGMWMLGLLNPAVGQKACSLQCEQMVISANKEQSKQNLSVAEDLERIHDLHDASWRAHRMTRFAADLGADMVRVAVLKRVGLVPVWGDALELMGDRTLQFAQDALKDQLDKRTRTIIVGELPRIREKLASRRDASSLEEAINTLLGPRFDELNDPLTKDMMLKTAIQILAAEIDIVRAEMRVSKAETATAFAEIKSTVVPMRKQVQKLRAQAEYTSKNLARSAESARESVEVEKTKDLKEGNQGQLEASARTAKVLGRDLEAYGGLLLETSTLAQRLGVPKASTDLITAAGAITILLGKAQSGLLDPISLLQGVNTLAGLFGPPRPDPTQVAIAESVKTLLEALEVLDQRNHARYLDTVNRIKNVENRVLEVQFVLASVALDGLPRCKHLLPTRTELAATVAPRAFQSYADFSNHFPKAASSIRDCKLRAETIFSKDLKDLVTPRFVADRMSARIDTAMRAAPVAARQDSVADLFNIFRQSIDLSTDLLDREALPFLSSPLQSLSSLDAVLNFAGHFRKCLVTERAKGRGSIAKCDPVFEADVFSKNFETLVDPETVQRAVRILLGILPYYELVDEVGSLVPVGRFNRDISERNRARVSDMLEGAHLLAAVSSGQQNAFGGGLILPIVQRILDGRYEDLVYSCTSGANTTDTTCSAPLNLAFIVNQTAVIGRTEERQKATRKTLEDRVRNLLMGTPRHEIFARNLSTFLVSGFLRENGSDLVSYELGRLYQGGPFLLNAALRLPAAYRLVPSVDSEKRYGPWILEVNNVRLPLPSAEHLYDGGFDTTPEAPSLAVLQHEVAESYAGYVNAPQIITAKARESIGRYFVATGLVGTR